MLEHSKSQQKGNVLQDNQAIELTEPELQRVVQSNLLAGQATFHHGLLVHSSPPNRSLGRRRCGLTVQYVTTEAIFEPMNYINSYEEDWRKPVLVAGEDNYGRLKYTTTM